MTADVSVVVLVGEDEDLPPGLDAVPEPTELRIARTASELGEALGDAQALFAWDFRRPLLRDAWPKARDLRWVHAGSAGVDALLFAELVASDVVLTNTRGVFERPMAEYVLALLLLFAKDLPTTLALQTDRTWRHRESEMLAGRRLLVVGVGPIGREIARLARATGMDVSGVGRRARSADDDFTRIGGRDDLDALLGEADDVVIAAPLTAETRGMFDGAKLARLRPGARLINVGRGPIVDEDALVESLRSGHVSAAGLDVFTEEPLPPEHPFWDMPRVVVSPHMSGDRVGWREAVVALFVENLHRWRAGEPLLHVVEKGRAHAQSAGSRG